MATYGDFPGVKITTQGGGITGVQVGSAERLVIFGEGDPSNGSASPNDPTQITSIVDADSKFGAGTELAEAMKESLANGQNIDYLYGVMLSDPSSTTETFTGAQDHTGASKLNAPIKEDLSTITVQDTVDGTSVNVEFRYETNTDSTTSDFTSNAPSNADTMFINPLTGEWVADSSSDYDITYEPLDFGTALNAADNVLNEGDTGVYAVLSESPNVHSTLSAKVTSLRNNYQMVQGVAGARPNKTDQDTSNAEFETSNYSDNIDNDAVYLVAPARFRGEGYTILGAVGGLLAGAPITEPVYNDALNGLGDLEQVLTSPEADDLRAEQVIPVRQGGSIRLKSNQSTSTKTDWTRDFWRRRIVDRVILLSKQVGEDMIGRINDKKTREQAETIIFAEMAGLVDDRLLKPNTQNETRWYVSVVEDDMNSDQANIDIGLTPQGIVKRIDERITVSA